MWDKKILAISDSSCVEGDFLTHLARLVRAGVDGVVLRERGLSEDEYFDAAREVLKICKKHGATCILHYFDRQALRLNHRYFHAPLPLLRQEARLRRHFHILGTSVHSKEELLEAVNYGVNYAFAGHIFESSCKEGLEGRGVEFLKSLLQFSPIPLYAIGGVRLENIAIFQNLSVAGVCMREALMRKMELKDYLKLCKKGLIGVS
ncbi:thiamine phosphate synthase [Campylobacter sp.]|uniref:thiamine phosphate synthase n=1 Tax=Campylobacter sp. TaxID=205 RepID=UPI0026DB0AFC|nr:thiamine phosphate synthase [Campylobacter sp.]MDO4674328.1 thiamine phosphate synthase [Campylobacter sp.]